MTVLLKSAEKLQKLESLGSALTLDSRTQSGSRIETSRVSAECVSPASAAISQAPNPPTLQNVLVATKAIHAVPALAAVRDRLDTSSVVVLLLNGVLGVYQDLISELFTEPSSRPVFLLGSTTHGAYRQDDFHTVHVGHGTCIFGLPEDAVPAADSTNSSSDQQQQQQNGSMVIHQQRDQLHSMSRQQTSEQGGTTSMEPSGAVHESQPNPAMDPMDSPHDKQPQQQHHYQQQQQHGGYLTPHQQQRAAEMLSLLSTLSALKPNVSLDPSQLEQQLLLKLVINCCANPLTALLHCKNGGLLQNPPAKALMSQVVSECKQVFGAKLPPSGAELLDMVEHVVGFNSSNYNSMLQDVVAGVPTEVLLLNGYVVREGRRQGVACPVNEMLCELVQAREAVAPDMRTVEQMIPHM